MRQSIFSIALSLSALLLSTCKDSGVNGKPPCPPFLIVPDSPYDSPIWHPSGEFIGFNHTPLKRITYPYGEHCQGQYEYQVDSAGFWMINPDGTNKRRIFPHQLQTPAWSPEGRWITFVAPVGSEAHIFKMHFTGTAFDTTSLVQLTTEGRNFFPAWSPDGRWIAYDRSLPDESGPAGIWRMRPDGSLKQHLFGGAFPSWHPNGNQLLGVVGTSPTSVWTRILRYELSQAKVIDTLAAVADADNRHPRYSPDGAKIAFWSNGNLWMMDSTGRNLQQLTTSGVDVSFGSPFSWSPDGSYIIYTRYRSDDWTYANGVLWVLNLETKENKQLTFNP